MKSSYPVEVQVRPPSEITEMKLQQGPVEPTEVKQVTKARPMKRTSSGDVKLDGSILELPKGKMQSPNVTSSMKCFCL